MSNNSVWIGFDPREAAAFAVARHSLLTHLSTDIPVHGLVLSSLIASGLFRRPMSVRDGRAWDDISGAACATEFSNSRFLIKQLASAPIAAMRQAGAEAPGPHWAMFMDCDMLVRADLNEVFALCDPTKAVMCVKHNHRPATETKMDNQVQTVYPRKNWSSVFILNVNSPANNALTVDLVNSVPGRDLHRFCWLEDDDIGELPVEWNWLAGHSDPAVDPKIVHHTDGSPCLPGYEDAPFADEWRAALADWAQRG